MDKSKDITAISVTTKTEKFCFQCDSFILDSFINPYMQSGTWDGDQAADMIYELLKVEISMYHRTMLAFIGKQVAELAVKAKRGKISNDAICVRMSRNRSFKEI